MSDQDTKADELKYVAKRGRELVIQLTYDVPFNFVFALFNASVSLFVINFVIQSLNVTLNRHRLNVITYVLTR